MSFYPISISVRSQRVRTHGTPLTARRKGNKRSDDSETDDDGFENEEDSGGEEIYEAGEDAGEEGGAEEVDQEMDDTFEDAIINSGHEFDESNWTQALVVCLFLLAIFVPNKKVKGRSLFPEIRADIPITRENRSEPTYSIQMTNAQLEGIIKTIVREDITVLERRREVQMDPVLSSIKQIREEIQTTAKSMKITKEDGKFLAEKTRANFEALVKSTSANFETVENEFKAKFDLNDLAAVESAKNLRTECAHFTEKKIQSVAKKLGAAVEGFKRDIEGRMQKQQGNLATLQARIESTNSELLAIVRALNVSRATVKRINRTISAMQDGIVKEIDAMKMRADSRHAELLKLSGNKVQLLNTTFAELRTLVHGTTTNLGAELKKMADRINGVKSDAGRASSDLKSGLEKQLKEYRSEFKVYEKAAKKMLKSELAKQSKLSESINADLRLRLQGLEKDLASYGDKLLKATATQSEPKSWSSSGACATKQSEPPKRILQNRSKDRSGLSSEQAKVLINEALEVFAADRVGRVDFASEAAGAMIVGSLTSKTHYMSLSTMLSSRVAPEAVIRPDVSLGHCWPFKGSTGRITIQLQPFNGVVPTAISIEHVPTSIAHNIGSAPRNFQAYAYDMKKESPYLLASGQYDAAANKSIQTFTFKNAAIVPYLQVRILTNHGHPGHTCIYRIRVHGSTRVEPLREGV